MSVSASYVNKIPQSLFNCEAFICEHGVTKLGVTSVSGDPITGPDADALLAKAFTCALGKHRDAKIWTNGNYTFAQLISRLTTFDEGKKDGWSIVPGKLHATNRTKDEVVSLDVLGIDIDSGESIPETLEKAKKLNRFCVLHTTHSHLKASTVVLSKALDQFAKKHKVPNPDTPADRLAMIKRILLEKKGYLPRIVEGITVDDERTMQDGGMGWLAHHVKMPKFRLYFPLADSFDITKYNGSQEDAQDAWGGTIKAVADELSLHFDTACLDASRLFFLPRHAPGAEFEAHIIRAPLLRWQDITPADVTSFKRKGSGRGVTASANVFDAAGKAMGGVAAKPGSNGAASSERCVTKAGFDLWSWSKPHAKRLNLADLIKALAPDEIRREVNSDKLEMKCPFDAFHSNAGDELDSAFFVANAQNDHSEWFGAFCGHTGCQDRSKTDFLCEMIDAGTIAVENITDPDYLLPSDEQQALAELNVAVELLTKKTPASELSKFLSGLVGLDIAPTDRNDIIAKFAAKTAMKIPDVVKWLNKIAKDAERVQQGKARVAALLEDDTAGMIFQDEDAAIAAMNAVAACLQVGSKTRFLICEVAGQELNFHDYHSAEAWFANWRLMSVDGFGCPKLVPLFDRWLASTKRRQYRNIVFKPDGVESNDDYNTWLGFQVLPDEHGDCRLLLRHMFSVLCNGNPDLFEYLLAWFAQMIQQPEVKPGVGLVVYSPEKGTGKSIIMYPLQKILGEHAKTLSSADALTNKFNSHMERALLVRGEEITWGGKRDAVGPLKAAITEEKCRLEKKYVDGFEIDNWSRFYLVSNEDRAIPAKGNDERRFFVLKAGDQYRTNIPYFRAMVEQLDSGGTAGFMHVLTTFNYERVQLRNPPKTKGLAEQIEGNLDPDVRWLMSALVDGAFVDADGEPSVETRDWETQPVTVQRKVVFDSFNSFVKLWGQPQGDAAVIGKFLKRHIPEMGNSQTNSGTRSYKFPSLPECRASFEKASGARFEGSATFGSDAVVDVDPSDDAVYEAERLLEMDIILDMILAPDGARRAGELSEAERSQRWVVKWDRCFVGVESP